MPFNRYSNRAKLVHWTKIMLYLINVFSSFSFKMFLSQRTMLTQLVRKTHNNIVWVRKLSVNSLLIIRNKRIRALKPLSPRLWFCSWAFLACSPNQWTSIVIWPIEFLNIWDYIYSQNFLQVLLLEGLSTLKGIFCFKNKIWLLWLRSLHHDSKSINTNKHHSFSK